MFKNNIVTLSEIDITLPKSVMIGLLASIYALAFIISPYWKIPASTIEIITLLALTLSMGVLWSYLSASSVHIHIQSSLKTWIAFAVLLVGMLFLNYRALFAAIPWRGDEDHHIGLALTLATKMQPQWIVFLLVAFTLPLYLTWHKPKWAIPGGILSLTTVIIFFCLVNPLQGIDQNTLLKYPLINYWIIFLAPKVAALISNPYYPALFRIVPFMAAFVLAWVFQKSLGHPETPLDFLWGFSVATLPVVFYYSSTLYLELPAVVLMTVVCLRIDSLLTQDFEQIKHNPGWVALILIGFIKETTITFLFCFIVGRIVVAFLRRRQDSTLSRIAGKPLSPFHQYLMGELGIGLAVLAPYILYLFLRSTYSDSRDFVLQPSILSNPSIYWVIGKSLVEQFGPFLILFVSGIVLLLVRREYKVVGFYLLIFLVVPLFHTVDRRGIYAGYSRFDLFMLPPILAATSILLNKIAEQRKIVGFALACGAIALSLLISPINLDGTKKPLWGNYASDTSEHYYPYPETLYWLKNTYGNERILFTGMYYDYYFDFYFNKFNWHPRYEVLLTPWEAKNEAETLSGVFAEARAQAFTVVVYHVRSKDFPLPQEVDHFIKEKVFENQAHILAVYHLIP